MELEPATDEAHVRRLAEAKRDHERQRRGLAAERVRERQAGLAERQVECSALVRPATVVAVDGEGGRPVEELERTDVLGVGVERLPIALGGDTAGIVVRLRGVRHVLADPLVSPAGQPDDRRHATELTRYLKLQAFAPKALDDQWQAREPV